MDHVLCLYILKLHRFVSIDSGLQDGELGQQLKGKRHAIALSASGFCQIEGSFYFYFNIVCVLYMYYTIYV